METKKTRPSQLVHVRHKESIHLTSQMVTQRGNTDRGRSSELSQAVTLSTRSTSKENRTVSILRPHGESRRIFLGLTLVSAGLFCTTLSHIYQAGHRLDSLPRQESSNLRPPTSVNDSLCRIYLAESSIPNGGLGVFTTEFIPKGGQVGDPGLCIQVHIPEGVGADQLFSHTHGTNAFFFGAERHGRQFCSGISTIVNTQMKRSNMAITALQRPSNAGLTRFDSPGAGAISLHYGQFHSVLKNIPAGTEITYDYGDWELPGEETKVTKQIMPHRPLGFIRQHGMCMDNIKVKPSLIAHAGRGAFASRAISTGDLVAPAPLIMIQNKHAFQENELLRNYMFEVVSGSLMAFVPYGEGVNFINHSRKPNVGLRWSTNKFHRGNLLTLSEHDFWEKAWPGALILEVYALRFIRPDEELVLDYGDSWETAWNNHVKHWKQKSKLSYVYPSDLDETEVLRTVKEQEMHPYPSNLAMACFNPFADDSSSDEEQDELEFRMTERVLEEEDYNCWCHVLDKAYDGKEEEILYTVSLQCSGRSEYHDYDSSIPKSQQEILTKVPRPAIRWENKPYQGDQFLKDAFRHSMAFPENLFPEQWKRVTSASTM
eukprot:CAMPEP_0202486578 /NCGR_PEP_ID=MMETSP1361-20130828/5108_1 /ASSEMBLY_ACC=CAM_ASM_000849 /TAXON_ID=210615 /ORGANISM="Staurosira complex sp., Strain CCMP2646" /LENGTH=599 /DNA_ID=CAMNT_0049115761 /DNA_START=2946 /DNA_END=4745 /DNA_ORIENTATION=-